MPHFTCDLSQPATPLKHFWEFCLGSGHAPLSLRADWQEQLRRCRQELGVRHVRFHGLLSGRMDTFLIHDDKPLYSFHNIDASFDAQLGMGVKPLVELSFMPLGLSSGGKTTMAYADNVTPPKDWAAWEKLISKLARHWVSRYGIEEVRTWPMEVWNEPNLEAFYTGKFDDYAELYLHTARAIKEVDGSLTVGGPVTAKNEWLDRFVTHCESKGLPMDFLSTHIYPTDAKGAEGDDTISQLAGSRRDVLHDKAAEAFAAAKGRPVYYTEWSSSSNPRDGLHDQPFAAAYAVKAILDNAGLVDAYSWWTFSDIFEENYFPSQVFQGGFGLLTIYNTPKPVYAAYRLMHDLGDEMLPCDGEHETVGRWVTRKRGEIQVMLTNMALPRHDIEQETVKLKLTDCPAPDGCLIRRVDDEHANPKRLWHEMGRPRYLDDGGIRLLDDAGTSVARPQNYQFDADSGILELSVSMPPQSVALITVLTDVREAGQDELPAVGDLPQPAQPEEPE